MQTSTTVVDNWHAYWRLTANDTVLVVKALDPYGNPVELPGAELPLGAARKYLPAQLCDRVDEEKFKDCPRMAKFLRGFRASRVSWHEYWDRHPTA
ncbi:hypothetical protein ACIBQ0_17335 [Nocardia nova]|uniref:hypothetical protein n=1 Tax=Nocardia nova TaxID=37330 RepID=UPI0037B7FA7C